MFATLAATLLCSSPAHAVDAEFDQALQPAKKPRWEVKGKAVEPFSRSRIANANEAYDDAVDLLVASLNAQPGCGECLLLLGHVLLNAERDAQASRVGHLLTAFFPEREAGWMLVARSFNAIRNWDGVRDAVEHGLALDPDEISYWHLRHFALLSDGEGDAALDLIDNADTKHLSEEHAACFRMSLHAASARVTEAKELDELCDEAGNLSLKRQVQAFVNIAEGDLGQAASNLVKSGASSNLLRLVKAATHLEHGRAQAALNLIEKIVEEPEGWSDDPENDGLDWVYFASDAYLYKAKALAELGRTSDAIDALKYGPMRDGWRTEHRHAEQFDNLLAWRGPSWHEDVLKESTALYIKLLVQNGESEKADRILSDAKEVWGDVAAFENARNASDDDATTASK